MHAMTQRFDGYLQVASLVLAEIAGRELRRIKVRELKTGT